MMNYILRFINVRYSLYSLILVAVLIGCEEEITPTINPEDSEIVVDGRIEMGPEALPPYVLLSRSFPFFGNFDSRELLKNNISDARVTVQYEGVNYPLEQVCLQDLPKSIKVPLAEQFGVDPSLLSEVDYCFYTDINRAIPLMEDGQYDLTIYTVEDTLWSTTTIPPFVGPDSVYYKQVAGASEQYKEMFARLRAPEGTHYYRYFIGEGQSPPRQTAFRSTFSDQLFPTGSFDFKLLKPLSQSAEPREDPTVLFYEVGDTVVLKWATMDEVHYNFWRTLEYNRQNQGPFSSYTRVESNILGGIGIWGGYHFITYPTVVK